MTKPPKGPVAGAGQGQGCSSSGPCCHPNPRSLLAGVPLPATIMWLLAAGTSQEEGLKILAPSYFPFKRSELPPWGNFVTSRAG